MNPFILDQLRAGTVPPPDASPVQRALWFDLHGDWAAAHRAVEQPDNAAECLVHAYLHRVEGDAFNAAYWYRRAGSAPCCSTLVDEQARLVARLFAGAAPSGIGATGQR